MSQEKLINLAELCKPALDKLHQYEENTDKTLQHHGECLDNINNKLEALKASYESMRNTLGWCLIILACMVVTLIFNGLSMRYELWKLKEQVNSYEQNSIVQEEEYERDREGTEQEQTISETNDGSSMESPVQEVL